MKVCVDFPRVTHASVEVVIQAFNRIRVLVMHVVSRLSFSDVYVVAADISEVNVCPRLYQSKKISVVLL